MVAYVGPGGQWVDTPDQSQGAVTGGGIPYRASRVAGVIGNAGIIDAIGGGTAMWHGWSFGDSRTAGIVTSLFNGRAPVGVNIGGVQASSATLNNTGFTTSAYSASGDALMTSGYSSNPDPWCRYEMTTVAATTNSATSALQRRMIYSPNTDLSTSFPALWARLQTSRAKVAGVVRRTSLSWSRSLCFPLAGTPSMPNIYLHMRKNGGTSTADAGYTVSGPCSFYTTDEAGYSLESAAIPAGFDWETYKAPEMAWVIEGGIAIGTANKIVGMSDPWIELPTGKLLHEIGCVSGRSIAALLHDELTPKRIFDGVWPTVGGNHFLWIAIGTNNPRSQTAAQFRSDLELFIARARNWSNTPNLPVVLLTSFAASSDGGSIPYYVQAIKEIAAADTNAVCLNTYEALPTYAAGSAAGLYADAVHYNTTGKNLYADTYWSLWQSA